MHRPTKLKRNKLMELINEWDPIGLIMMSAPQDEYAPEVDRIFEKLEQGMSVEEVFKLIDNTFHYYFNNNSLSRIYETDSKTLLELAEKVHALL